MEEKTGGSGGGKKMKRKGDLTIDSFFVRKVKRDEGDANRIVPCMYTVTSGSADANASASSTQVMHDSTASSSGHESEPMMNKSVQASTSTNTACLQGSVVGTYIGRATEIDDFTKCALLEEPWTPPSNYCFPYSVIKKLGKDCKKYAQRSHLEKYHWLVMSEKERGYLCKYCVFFANENITKGRPKSLVNRALLKFDDCLGEKGYLRTHERNLYHQKAVQTGKDFLLTFHAPEMNVLNQVSAVRKAQVMENRARLIPIIETIIFCGRENIALRGHRGESGRLLTANEEKPAPGGSAGPIQNDGIFRALLRFRVSAGDKTLEDHLRSSKANATYISNKTQNKLILCCKEEIQSIILGRVKSAVAYAIMFDETTDIAQVEQLSLSFRYIYENSIREDFITFMDAYECIRPEDCETEERRLTGVALAHIVEDLLTKFSIDLKKCVGVGTDSCSVMASDVKGAVQELIKKAVNARRCPCTNHMLNNSLSKTSKVVSCRNATGTIKKIIAFARASPKRYDVFKSELGKSLSGLCETRWGEKHDGHLQFRSSLPKICTALMKISKWQDNKTAADAYCLMQAIRCTEFLVSLICVCDVLGTTVSLSRLLQSPSLDLKKASDAINDTKAVLEEKRHNACSHFQNLFQEVTNIANELNLEVTAPRALAGKRSQYRENQPSECPVEYYRRAIYIPLLDSILADIRDRFPEDVLRAFDLRVLVPSLNMARPVQNQRQTDVVLSVASKYEEFLGVPAASVMEEFKLWCVKWGRVLEDEGSDAFPSTLLDAITACDADMYPNICLLLKILVTMPVSVATAERSFSTLRRLKTWLRNRMGEERLTGLALLNVHRDVNVDVGKVIERFATTKNRVDFVI